MKLTAATMIISRVCVYHFERFERALKNVSDEIRLKEVRSEKPPKQSNFCPRKTPTRTHSNYSVLDVNQYWFCCGSKRLHCAGTLWIRTGSRIVRFRSRIKTVPVGRIKTVPVGRIRMVPVPQD